MTRTSFAAVAASAIVILTPGLAVAQAPVEPLASNVRVSQAGPDGSTSFRAERPAAAYAPAADRFLVVWQEEDDNDETELFGRLLDGAGEPVAAPFQITSTVGGDPDATVEPADADVAFHPGSGRFYVTYSAARVSGGRRRILVRSVDLAGVPSAPTDLTSTAPDFDRGTRPAIACAASGDRCVVVYEHTVDTPPVGGVLDDPLAAARAFVPSTLTALGTHTILAGTSAFNRAATVPSITATGRSAGAAFVVSWRHEEGPGDEEVYTRDISLDGTPVGPQVARTTSGNAGGTAIAHGGPGGPDELLLTWSEAVGSETVIMGRRLDPGAPGQPELGGFLTVSTGTADTAPSVAFEPGLQRWVVSYTDTKASRPGLSPSKQELFARTLDTSGAPVGAESLIGGLGAPDDDASGVDIGAALVAKPGGGFFLSVVAGSDPRVPGLAQNEREVFARRVGAALAPPPSSDPVPPGPVSPAPSGAAPGPAASAAPVVPSPAPVVPPAPTSVFDDPTATPADLTLACSGRAISLIDVLPAAGGRVLVTGAARSDLVGRRLTIRRGKTTVGSATVGRDGTFRAVVKGPRSARERVTVRYTALAGRQASRSLKLSRRMTISSLRRSSGRLVFAGRVAPPLGKPRGSVIVERQTSCTTFARVAAVKPRADGRFTARFAVPAGAAAAVYRARTSVPTSSRSRKLFPTFTLPRPVALG